MDLIFEGIAGERVSDWGSYALVRDNVQHFIEKGQPNGRFPELHGIESAVDEGAYLADAARLRGEVLRAIAALGSVALDGAALTARTRAVMMGSSRIPKVSQTVNAQAVGWELPVPPTPNASIPVAAFTFLDAVLSLTATAVDGDQLTIRRSGAAPVFAPGGDACDGARGQPPH